MAHPLSLNSGVERCDRNASSIRIAALCSAGLRHERRAAAGLRQIGQGADTCSPTGKRCSHCLTQFMWKTWSQFAIGWTMSPSVMHSRQTAQVTSEGLLHTVLSCISASNAEHTKRGYLKTVELRFAATGSRPYLCSRPVRPRPVRPRPRPSTPCRCTPCCSADDCRCTASSWPTPDAGATSI